MMKKLLPLIALFLLFALLLCACGEATSTVTLGNILILGDSYSTFRGFIPEGYDSWYSKEASYIDVKGVEDTWWHQLAERTGGKILRNDSYSGTTVCHRGYHGEDYSHKSFLARFDSLVAEGFFDHNRIDTLIVYGGLNDYWAGTEPGEICYEEPSEEDLYTFFPALISLLSKAKETLPEGRILFVLEEDLGEAMKDGIRQVCRDLSIELIETEGIEKVQSHPNRQGMKQLADQIIDYLEKEAS